MVQELTNKLKNIPLSQYLTVKYDRGEEGRRLAELMDCVTLNHHYSQELLLQLNHIL